ncbi:MAG: hypothetical protein ACOCZB_08970 [Spirochaetota bacterium]
MGVAYDDYSFAPDEEDIVYLSTEDEGKGFVRRGDIPAIMADEFTRDALGEWNRYRRFGLANGQGWRQERMLYVRVLEVCEQEFQHAREMMRQEKRGQR